MKKTVFSLFVIILFVISASFFTVNAEERGWSYTFEDSVLTVTGTGEIDDGYYWGFDISAVNELIIGEGVTRIGDRAFENFYALERVELPHSLKEIGNAVFENCQTISYLTLPYGVEYIGDYAFAYCNSLVEIEIPESVKYLGTNLFDHCYALSYVKLPATLNHLPAVTFSYCLSLKEISLPGNVSSMGHSVFSSSGIETIKIPSGVTVIPERAFENCGDLDTVELPDTLESIEYRAFACSALDGELTLPCGVENIYGMAFYDTDIDTLSLPSALSHTDCSAFGMTRLTYISVAADNPNYASFEGCLYSKDLSVLYMYTNGDGKSEVIVDPRVKEIAGYAFGGNNTLTVVYLPFGLEVLHDEAFAGTEYYKYYPYYCYKGTPADEIAKQRNIDNIVYLNITDISVADMPYRTQYTVAEAFDPAGLTLCVTDAFGGKSYFTGGFEVGEYDFSKEGKSRVTVSLWGYAAEIWVTVYSDVPVPKLSSYGVRITIDGLYEIKDCFIAKGYFNSYDQIKQNGYIVRLTPKKTAGKAKYSYTVSDSGMHTVLVRYNDGRAFILYDELTVDEPMFTANGLQITVSNIPDVKVIRTVYGEYYTPGDTKRAEGARNFSNKSVIKDAESYTLQYREEGRVTIIVEYNNGYVKVFHYDVTKKIPTVEHNDNTVTFANLDGLNVIRYAMGKYATSSEIKRASGSQYIKPDSIVDGKITVADLAAGTYTFCVQYDDESYNYYTVVV